MKTSILLVSLILTTALTLAAQSASLQPADLASLPGTWTGSLTYLDYGSNKKTSIKSDVKVTADASDPQAWTFEYIYPDEPKANGKSVVKLSADGRMFNDQTVIARSTLADGTQKVVTTREGTDNDKKALFRYTYLISPAKFSILKEAKAEGSDAYFERNSYSWTRLGT
jgi:hypothetical protein